MPRNTHTFEQGETFGGQQQDETIRVVEVRNHTLVWDYIVGGKQLGRNVIEKEKARKYIQYGYWK